MPDSLGLNTRSLTQDTAVAFKCTLTMFTASQSAGLICGPGVKTSTMGVTMGNPVGRTALLVELSNRRQPAKQSSWLHMQELVELLRQKEAAMLVSVPSDIINLNLKLFQQMTAAHQDTIRVGVFRGGWL